MATRGTLEPHCSNCNSLCEGDCCTVCGRDPNDPDCCVELDRPVDLMAALKQSIVDAIAAADRDLAAAQKD